MRRLTQFCLALSQHLCSFNSTRLLALFLLALSLAWTISRGEVTAEVLFQSPESPVVPVPVPVEQEFVPEAPVPVEEVVPVVPVEPEIPVEPAPVEEVVPVVPVEPAPVEEVAPVVPVEPEIPVEPLPELVQPQAEPGTTIESPVPPQSAPDQQTEAPVPAAPEPSSRRVDPEEQQIDDEFEEDGEANFILDRAEFIDTVVVSTAYVWLCCGIVIFLMIPLVFLFLQIRGRTKMSRDNFY